MHLGIEVRHLLAGTDEIMLFKKQTEENRSFASDGETSVRLRSDKNGGAPHVITQMGSPFPMYLLMTALVLPMLLIAGLGWHVWRTYWDFKKTQFHDIRLRELYSTIIYYDEILTTSARMAVATNNFHWAERYVGFIPQRETAMAAAKILAPETFTTEDGKRMSAAKLKLTELEAKALDMVQQGRSDVATMLLFGKQYDELKQTYLEGMQEIAKILESRVEMSLQAHRHRTIFAVSAIGIALPFLIFAWFGVLRTIGRQIAERKRAEEKMIEAMEVKYAFTSMVSHELRTPLAAIKENIDIVLDETAGGINPDQRDFLGSAKKNVDRLGRLINDVLDYQKLESKRMEFHIAPADMNEVVRETAESMKSLVVNQGLNLMVNLADNLPKIPFDRDKIIQVLMNLISNAVKFTERGEITIATSRTKHGIVVSVKDTGIGIQEKDMPKLFHSFSQITSHIDRKPGSTGLGLAISKEILLIHGGKIWAESAYGKGSTFSFILPIKAIAKRTATLP